MVEREREKEKEGESGREREKEKEGESGREREKEGEREYLFLKGMTSALAPFSYLVKDKCRAIMILLTNIFHRNHHKMF